MLHSMGLQRIGHDLLTEKQTNKNLFYKESLCCVPLRKNSAMDIMTCYWLYQFSSATHLCLTLCNPGDCSMPGFPVHHQLRELAQAHVPFNHFILCCPLLFLPSIFPSIRVFSKESVFTSGGQSIGASALASGLPMNIQD